MTTSCMSTRLPVGVSWAAYVRLRCESQTARISIGILTDRKANHVNEAAGRVTVKVGTDLILPGIIPGYSVHEEMAIWQEAGIPPAEVLRSATIVPARFMGLDNRLGAIAEGKAASMVLLRVHPLKDVRNAQQVEGVFLRGRYFIRDDLTHLLEEAKDLAHK
jgi:adenine deaminase